MQGTHISQPHRSEIKNIITACFTQNNPVLSCKSLNQTDDKLVISEKEKEVTRIRRRGHQENGNI